jgi:Putative adhesin
MGTIGRRFAVHRFVVAIALSATVAMPVAAQTKVSSGKPFDWTGQIAAGGQLRILDVHGDIHVTAATGDRIVVHAEVRNRGGHDDDLTFDVVPDGDNMLICARWSDGPACTPHGMRHGGYDSDGESAVADFTVQLPRNLRLDAGTGNGRVDVAGTGTDVAASSGNGTVRVAGATGKVNASSGNGEVTVEDAGGPVSASTGNGAVKAYTSAGPVNASSGNGDIDVRMTRLAAQSDMSFSTGNGTITVALPANFSGDLEAETGHGSVSSDFPLQVSGRFGTSRMHGTIGSGGERLRLSSGNGDLVLRKL